MVRSEKNPSLLVMVPVTVPLMLTLTPGRFSLFSCAVTKPEISMASCACKCDKERKEKKVSARGMFVGWVVCLG